MNPVWKHRLAVGGSLILAVWLAWQAAERSYTLPALAGVIAVAAILVRLTRLPADVILLGLLLIGYLVGNRGFAQLMPLPGLPLFPAEFGLAVGLGWLVIQAALRREIPGRADALNWMVLIWLVVGTARLPVDFRRFGLLAVRDYAMVYYAAFFFLAQHYARERRAQRYLVACLTLAAVVLLPVYFLFEQYPFFFLFHLTVRGVPLIYPKGDLVYTFLAAGSVAIFHLARGSYRYWGWGLATLLFLGVVAGNSRAALVGVAVAMGWLLVSRRWAFPALQGGAVAAALLAVAALAYSGLAPWAEGEMAALSDRVASIADLRGTYRYESVSELDKSGNNQFRLVWWRTVLEDTWTQGPVFGLGFGYNLAASFLEEYDPAMGEDFTARSPHSIVIGTVGRMGAVGLAALLAVVAAMTARTWRALRDRSTDPTAVGLWCAAWVVFISACFGVVLEGPMGAIVFWSVLGLANGMAGGVEVPAAGAAMAADTIGPGNPRASPSGPGSCP